ncbi:MAG: ferredoxin--NADP reductase [Planctomycetes bacterium]|nr:ferredoxin--NADP reductase [Planctomycetota bacterium]
MNSQALITEQAVYNATLIHRTDVTPELSVVRFRPDSGLIPEFLPGQFIKLGLPREEGVEPVQAGPGRPRSGPRLIRRAYSIASSPRQRDCVEIFVVRVEGGKLTPKLWVLDLGGRAWMDDKISGRFTLDPVPPHKDVVMVATGTGIAPFVSMLRTYHDQPRWRRAVLINGVRYAPDLGYREELEALARANPRVRYIPIVSRDPGDGAWTGLRGRVQVVLDPAVYESQVGAALDPDDCHVMLCGNPEMIDSVQAMLAQRGFRPHSSDQPGNIHFERYW